MADYFSHDYRAREDPKMLLLFMEKGLKGIGLYWCLVEMLYERDGYISLKEISVIAFSFRTNKQFVESIIKDYELFKTDNENFYSDSGLKRLALIKEKRKIAQQNVGKRWGKIQNTNNGNTTVIPQYNNGNTKSYKDKDKDKDKDILKENIKRKTTTTNFVIPSLLEISSYCKERNNNINAEAFKDYYDSKGWMIGKNKMKDWKAAIRTWERNEKPINEKRSEYVNL